MYGTATVEASSMEEAVEIASNEFDSWNTAGIDLATVSVDGADVEP
jgi:hypothetical protein